MVVLVGPLLLAAGCGGSGSSAASSASRSEAGGASAKFSNLNSTDDKFLRFGREASPADREAASKVLEENLKARANADFAEQCATLSAAGIKEVLRSSKRTGLFRSACPKALREIAEPLSASKKVRADTLAGPIAVLRIKEDRAYALYHGNDKTDYAMPLVKENGSWKVSSLTTTSLG